MNDDFEQELHEMLQERGSRPIGAPQAPPKVLRRARRRQLSTALVSGATALAVIGGAILGAQALSRNTPQKDIAETPEHSSTRTVQLFGYGISYPYDWALQTVNAGISPADPGREQPVSSDGSKSGEGNAQAFRVIGPYLQLSNLYPDHLLDLACGSTDLPADGVAFQVNAVPMDMGGDGGAGLSPVETCPDGSTFSAGLVPSDNGDSGVVFMTHAKVGADATEADRQALFDAFDSIEPPSGDTGVKPGLTGVGVGGGFISGTTSSAAEGGDSNESTPAPIPGHLPESVSTVVAAGTTASGKQWVMMVDGNMNGGSVSIDGMGVSWGWAWAESPDGSKQQPTMPDFDGSVSAFDANGTPIAFGSVIGAATSVEVRPNEGDAIAIDLLPAPAVTGIDRSYFLQELPDLGSDTGSIVALDAQGGVVGEQKYDVTSGNVSPGSPGCPKPMPTGEDGGGVCVVPPDCPVPTGAESSGEGVNKVEIDCTIPPVCPATAENDPCTIPPCPDPTDPGQPAEEPTDPAGFIGCLPPPMCPDTPVSSDDPSGPGGSTAEKDCTIIVPPTCDVVGDPGGSDGSGGTQPGDAGDPTATGTAEEGTTTGGGEDPNGPIACSVGGGTTASGGSVSGSGSNSAAGEGAASAGAIAATSASDSKS
jgi:hypothetical protein